MHGHLNVKWIVRNNATYFSMYCNIHERLVRQLFVILRFLVENFE